MLSGSALVRAYLYVQAEGWDLFEDAVQSAAPPDRCSANDAAEALTSHAAGALTSHPTAQKEPKGQQSMGQAL